MRKLLATLLVTFSLAILNGQQNINLKNQLWDKVQNCNKMFEDVDGDGKLDMIKVIDDSKNGYLLISGQWPTCGCGCEEIIGAYKKQTGEYIFIQESTWNCSWTKAITSNVSLDSIFPNDIEENGFFSKRILDFGDNAFFYLDIEIPKIGTETKMTIKTIPFGIKIINKKIISFTHLEQKGYSNCVDLYYLKKISDKLINDSTLDLIAENQFNKISKEDLKTIDLYTNEKGNKLINKLELSNNIKDLKRTYEIYCQIEHESLILEWNNQKGKFYIKEKGPKPTKITFKEFIINNEFWSLMC